MLILGGSRSAGPDQLAHRHYVAHKALIPIAGKAIVGRVLDALEQALPQSNMIISTERFELLRQEPTISRLFFSCKLSPAAARANLADSVLVAAEAAIFPLIVTTADNALLSPDAIQRLLARAKSSGADAMLVLTPLSAVEAEEAGTKTAYTFRDGCYCNCNLFWIRDREALAAVEAFRSGGQFLKVRGRFLRTFGLMNVVRYALRQCTLQQMLDHISRRLGVDVEALVLEDEGLLLMWTMNARCAWLRKYLTGEADWRFVAPLLRRNKPRHAA